MEVGVNFPPIHPNCRCTTHGYLGEDEEKSLQRRARNPLTGKNEIVENMSYKEWKEKNINKLGSGKNSDLYVKPHKQMQYLDKIDNLNDDKAIDILEKYEKSIVDSDIENAIMILDDGRIFQSYGVSDEVYPYYDLLNSSTTKNNYIVYMTHNHPKKETNYSFDGTDRNLFSNQNKLKVLRGEDYKYKYMFSRLNDDVDLINYSDAVNRINFENVQHTYNVEYAHENKIGYTRWGKDVITKTDGSQGIR